MMFFFKIFSCQLKNETPIECKSPFLFRRMDFFVKLNYKIMSANLIACIYWKSNFLDK
jgi:hypothetical protein